MNIILRKRFIIALLILSILLAACQPDTNIADTPTPTVAATATPVPQTPTVAAPTAIPVQDSAQAGDFLEKNGFLVLATQNEDFPIIVMTEDEGSLVPILEEGEGLTPDAIQGAVWYNDEEESVAVFTGEDHMPSSMVLGDLVAFFTNYTDTRVDIALYQGNELISVTKGVELDAAQLQQYQGVLAESGGASGHLAALNFVPPQAKSTAAKLVELAGLSLTLTVCTVSLLHPISAWASITVCGPAFLNAVTFATEDDLQIFGMEVPIVFIDAVGCIDFLDALSCVSLIIDGISYFLDKADERMSDANAAYEESYDDPTVGSECRGSRCRTLELENYSGTTDTFTLIGPAEYTFPFGFGTSSHSVLNGTYEFTYTACDGKWTMTGTLYEHETFWSFSGPRDCH